MGALSYKTLGIGIVRALVLTTGFDARKVNLRSCSDIMKSGFQIVRVIAGSESLVGASPILILEVVTCCVG